MSPRYDPQAHILPLEVAPRTQSIIDQREITIQPYQTVVAFDYEALDGALDRAWLTPQIRFEVFSRSRLGGKDALHVVVGLQDELRVRTYDLRRAAAHLVYVARRHRRHGRHPLLRLRRSPC